VKAGLGDDASDGWLLLGGPGAATVDNSQTATRANAGAGQAARAAISAAATLSSHGSPGGGGGGAGGGGGRNPINAL
jgi:hypothetical protein